ncbi:MAG: hypothetical protein EA378_02550 [Phycisphaerales bacterium]|nr:MAG: hypothetical protein EA378_02550 [Phycisphaerales bacterium]
MRGFRKLIPSMFHRRLVLLGAALLVPASAMAVQLTRLTVLEGAQLRAEAESRLVRRSWTPTVRGRVLDRHGRVLAHDRPSYDVEVSFDAISGAWAERHAGAYARRRHAEAWPKLAPAQRAELIARYRPIYEAHAELAWERFALAAGIPREELEARKARVSGRVSSMFRAIVDARRRHELEAALARGRELTAQAQQEIERRASRPILEQRSAHALAFRVPDEVGFEFQRLAEQRTVLTELLVDGISEVMVTVPTIPGLEVAGAGDRRYPFETVTVELNRGTLPSPLRGEGYQSVTVTGVLNHVLGWVATTNRDEDVLARRSAALDRDPSFHARAMTERGVDRGAYRAGDVAGRAGVEFSGEHELRGLRGLRTERLETGERTELPPEPGRDVVLTIDAMLQARVQAAMSPELGLAVKQDWHGSENETIPDGTVLPGAAVVLDIDTGEILAMVSTPTFTREQMQRDPSSVFEDEINRPFINRAVAVPYQPGSIVKPLLFTDAVTHGHVRVDERIDCTGHFLPNRQDVMRCWIYRPRFGLTTHNARFGGPLDVVDSLMVSCNIFYYTLGQRLNRAGVTRAYQSLGVGSPMSLGVGYEHAGRVGPGGDPRALEPSDPIFLGIGQGPIDWTPVHAAEAYATLARGGVRMRPRVIDDGSFPEIEELGWRPASVDAAIRGLDKAVNDRRGTGNHLIFAGRYENLFNTPGVTVWGKTGTAQASPLVVRDEATGESRVVRTGEHSWFVVVVGPEGGRARYAIAVVMEYAGSGGRVSGPIANQIIHALRAEGYL